MNKAGYEFDINAEILVSAADLAAVVGADDDWIRQLGDRGVLTIVKRKKLNRGEGRYFNLYKSIKEYCLYKEQKEESPDDVLAKARMELADLRYKAARADKLELELAELRGQMHRSEDVDDVTSDMIVRIRGEILALPGRLAVDVAKANTAKVASAVIKREIDELLNDMAGYRYDPSEYAKRVSEREKWLSVQEAETAAKEEVKAARSTSKKSAPSSQKAAKKSSGKQQPSSKSSARSSGHRKT